MKTIEIITLKEGYKKSNKEIIDIVENNKNISMFQEEFNEKLFFYKNKLEKIKNLHIISYWDDIYPEQLKNIPDPPVILYAFGDVGLLNTDMISVVGTRKATQYGKKMTSEIVRMLSNYTIISGMAFGIDTIAHENSEKTIAILGCGIDIVYPKSNFALYEKLKKENLILSEYFPGTPPLKHFFPYRNRIIAALSEKTIVIEAAKKSGSLITARFAIEYGKEVYALPGDITRFNSKGTNYLIYCGALPIYSLELINELFKKDNFEEKINCLDFHEKNLYNIIKEGINDIDKMCEALNVTVSFLLTSLMKLQIDGLIIENDGYYYLK